MIGIDTQNKELIVRKRMSAFIEKALRFCGHDFRHDDYKKIIYGETGCKTDLEYMFKSMYDAYTYLLSNAQSPLTTDMLKRFFYLLEGKECDEAFLIRVTSKMFYMNDMPALEKAVDFHMYVYTELCWMNDDYRLIVPLMFFNYALVKSGVPTLRFISPTLSKYERCRDLYLSGDTMPMHQLMLDQLSEAKFQDRDFYQKLKPLATKEICDRIHDDRELLHNRYGIESIALFGSFSKELQRLDSDIDLLIVYSQDISYEKKIQLSDDLASYYFNVFNRYIDITEISEYVKDWIINETSNYTKIF